jgi:hypothetical protein
VTVIQKDDQLNGTFSGRNDWDRTATMDCADTRELKRMEWGMELSDRWRSDCEIMGIEEDGWPSAGRILRSSQSHGAVESRRFTKCNLLEDVKILFYSLRSLRGPSMGTSLRCYSGHLLRPPPTRSSPNRVSLRTKHAHDNLNMPIRETGDAWRLRGNARRKNCTTVPLLPRWLSSDWRLILPK